MAIAIIFVDYKDVTRVSHGGYVTTYKPVFEYIITILRFGIIGMFIGLFIGWKGYNKNQKTQQEKSYYLTFFFFIFIVSIILMVVFNW
jgi:hypothetical protein